ncbi:hypothetical protein BJV82DRAFT_169316 [Fennellomyces sp. T-0311]|nr:hypothetical protein BJV82DRAFT_169316 [Fennellomyces sp. T-0311]
MPSVQTVPNRGEKNLNRIEDDTGELDYLRNQLSRMDGLSDELVSFDTIEATIKKLTTPIKIGILDGFDGRLMKLEASIRPIHKSTQNLTKLATNLDRALAATDNIVNCLNLPSKEEAFILKGPDEHNVLPYLQIMGKLKDAVDSVEQNQLKSCEKAVNQMVRMEQ